MSFRYLVEKQTDLFTTTPIHRPDYSCAIDPEGSIHYVPYHGHSAFAKSKRGTVDTLVRKGWIFISCQHESIRVIQLPDTSQGTYDRFFDWAKFLPESMLDDKSPVVVPRGTDWTSIIPTPTIRDLVDYWIG